MPSRRLRQPRVASFAPEGRLRIAQQFTAGEDEQHRSFQSPVGTIEDADLFSLSSRPYGTLGAIRRPITQR